MQSKLFGDALFLGQTTVFTLGVFIFLLCFLLRGHQRATQASDVLLGITLFLLSIKVTYLALGVGICLLERRWRALGWAGTLIGIALVGVTLRGGLDLLLGYLDTIRGYATGSVSNLGFAWNNWGSSSPTWLTLSRILLGDPAANFIGRLFLVVASLGFALLCWRGVTIPSSRRLLLGTALLVGTYLLCSPYVGRYEYLLLTLPLVPAIASRGLEQRWLPLLLALGFALVLILIPSLPLPILGLCVSGALIGFFAASTADSNAPNCTAAGTTPPPEHQ